MNAPTFSFQVFRNRQCRSVYGHIFSFRVQNEGCSRSRHQGAPYMPNTLLTRKLSPFVHYDRWSGNWLNEWSISSNVCINFSTTRLENDHSQSVYLLKSTVMAGRTKNRYTLSFFKLLVWSLVFEIVQVCSLPFGHRHGDVDQTFTATWLRLRHQDALSMNWFHEQQSRCYNNRTVVSSLNKVANFLGLCNELTASRPSTFSLNIGCSGSQKRKMKEGQGLNETSCLQEVTWSVQHTTNGGHLNCNTKIYIL